MHLSFAIAFMTAALACSSAPPATQASPSAGSANAPLTITELVAKSKPAIVRVEARMPVGGSVGTGFVLDPAGRIGTNFHVIAGATEIEVVLLGGTRLPVTGIAAIDPQRDLAILKVKTDAELPSLALGDSQVIAAGDPVVAIGNPLGVLDYTVSDGLISSVRELGPEITVLQISAPISLGSSGGPLFNSQGEVIGVATAILAEGQNLNFGIPSNYLRDMLAQDLDLSVDELARKLADELRRTGDGSGAGPKPGVRRQIPQHSPAVLKGCDQASLDAMVEGISEAINLGAPLYNDGNHEACYRIYEGTALRLESESSCPGLREAMGQGLLRASTMTDHTRKAWALRDAFDGILLVISRQGAAQP